MPSLTNLFSTLLFASIASSKACAPHGAVLPAPRDPHSSPALSQAAEGLRGVLDGHLEKVVASGISVGVKSIHGDKPLFDYHFTPEIAEDIGTDKIDADTIYRVGSVSKLMPVLAVLQLKGVNLDDSILEYVPGLAANHSDSLSATHWGDVTIRSLMSHMSGIATDTVFDMTLMANAPWTELGLPEIPAGEGLTCAGIAGTEPCTGEDLVAHLAKSPPTYNPYTAPSYSNSASSLLALVVEKVTGKDFNEVVQSSIFDKAGMKSTSFGGPVDAFEEHGFVPKEDPLWNSTFGIYEAAGGMFSSTNDLLSFGSAILDHELLSSSKTKAWLHPVALLPSYGQAIGGPWEIFRSENLTSDNRIIDVYTKSGDMGLYHAYLALVPEYDLVISVLVGGLEVSTDRYARSRVLSAAVSAFVPAMEQAAREEASCETGQVGTYTDEETDSKLVLELDEGSGLLIKEFSVRGFDVLGNIDKYGISTAGSSGGSAMPKRQSDDESPAVEGRLYPAQRTTKNAAVWRAVFPQPMPDEYEAALQGDIFYADAACESWFSLDRLRYGFQNIAEFIFETDSEGAVKTVKNPAFDVKLSKVQK